MKQFRITSSALILRSEPRKAPETDTGTLISPGDTVTGFGQSYDGKWTAVKVGSATGWAGTSFLKETDDSSGGGMGGVAAVAAVAAAGAVAAAAVAVAKKSAKPKWRTAKSLAKLLSQVNAAAPGRKKSHDGTIGDTAHQKTKSDHNPNANGVVTALDITHDPDRGCDCAKIAAALVASKDPRIKYIIFQGKIVSSLKQPWVWRPYTGANPHMKHLHLSVDAAPQRYDDDSPWQIS